MIINTGQRTDIPAFYSKWFMNRIKEGYVMVRNPYYPSQVTKFILDPKVVDVIGFCTKNPRPMFNYLDDLKDYGQFWYITITAFGKDLEPNVPQVNQVIEDFKYLSKKVGSNAIGLRYTPIIINDKYSVSYHIQTFQMLCEQLDGYTNLVTFGFLDLYDKLKKYHPDLTPANDADKIIITKSFQTIAKEHRMDLRLCSKEKWLKDYGIDVNGCMRQEDYEKAINCRLNLNKINLARKNYCNCILTNDIGAYNSCPHLCKYCYANANPKLVMNNYHCHDDNSPLLIGQLHPNDIIKIAKQQTNKEYTLF